MSSPRTSASASKNHSSRTSNAGGSYTSQSSNATELADMSMAARGHHRLSRPNNVSNASSRRLTPTRRIGDKYTQVAAELPALFAGGRHLTSPNHANVTVLVADALQDIRLWATEKPENLAKLGGMLRAADGLVPIDLTSKTQIGYNMAAADTDGHVKKYFEWPEIMRAIGACVLKAWLDLGHGVLEHEREAGSKAGCCVVL